MANLHDLQRTVLLAPLLDRVNWFQASPDEKPCFAQEGDEGVRLLSRERIMACPRADVAGSLATVALDTAYLSDHPHRNAGRVFDRSRRRCRKAHWA